MATWIRIIHTGNEKPVVARKTDTLVQEEKIQKIAQFLNVSPTYLLRGEEENVNLKYEDDERELIRLYRFLNADSKEKVLRMAGALAANA